MQHESRQDDSRKAGAGSNRDTVYISRGGNVFMTVAGFTSGLISAYIAICLFAILSSAFAKDTNFPNMDRVWLVMMSLVVPLLILVPMTIMYYFVVDVEAAKRALTIQFMRERLDTPSDHLAYIRSKLKNI